MNTFMYPLESLSGFEDAKFNIEKGAVPIQVTGCIDSQKVHFMSGLSSETKQKLIVTYDEQSARKIYDDCKFFNGDAVIYPAKDFIFFSADVHGNLILQQRLALVKKLLSDEPVTVITTFDGLMDKILPLDDMRKNVIKIKSGEKLDLEACSKKLVKMGYERTAQADVPGQFAVRGSILDVYPLTEEVPYRIDLWDDEVDIIKTFDAVTQRSIENMEGVTIYPATEYVLSDEDIAKGINNINKELKKYEESLRKKFKTEEAHRIKMTVREFLNETDILRMGTGVDSFIDYFREDTVSLIDYFDDEAMVFLDEPNHILEHVQAIELEFKESMAGRLEKGYILPGQSDVMWDSEKILEKILKRKTVLFTTLDQRINNINVKNKVEITAGNVSPYNNRFDVLVDDLKNYKKRGYSILLLSASPTRAERLAEDLREYDLNAFYSKDMGRKIEAGEIMVSYGKIHKGFQYPLIKFIVISDADIFGEKKKKKRKKKQYSGQKIASFTDLTPGDYVIHENHGLGLYRGIEKVEVDRVKKDYIKIEYAGNGFLYVPAAQSDIIQKYAGSDAGKYKLNKLGSPEWSHTKAKVKKAVAGIAKDLVELYAKRQMKDGYQFSEDTVWQKEFEELFPFEETEDQLNAIDAVKADMQSKKIMDRLICGDVGYGKTEIAIRAAFKAVQDNKQVVFLVPTTVLAQQHYNTFCQRFKDFPVRVDLLSRFRTPAEQKKTLTDLKKGFVDIVIGTHRVLSKDVEYKDLGLLIIDEEQRFGVRHKEKIKQLKDNVDVMSLTATPIPRTLHMSLIGVRDMSVLEEPPVDRVPIQTYVMEYNDEIIREAINREMARGGQVYYVFNRVREIDSVAAKIAGLVPDANVAYAHGQMSERRLEQIMYDFVNGDIDVLVSTTIIETGLDISNVNTMIIHNADKFGLSQLYQLRGRVGRSSRTAYTFLMYRRDKILSEVAEKRLSAIREFTELGSGFKIAMKDLEIRGAGDLLGAEQHGHMDAVGYDLYCKMLNEAVMQIKGISDESEFETTVDLVVDAYKRIAAIETEEEYHDMEDEMFDRFGDIPKQVTNLLDIALMKSKAKKAQITDITGNKACVKIVMYNRADIQVEKIPKLVEEYNGQLRFAAVENPYFTYVPNKQAKDFAELKVKLNELIEKIYELKKEKEAAGERQQV